MNSDHTSSSDLSRRGLLAAAGIGTAAVALDLTGSPADAASPRRGGPGDVEPFETFTLRRPRSDGH